MEKLTYAIAMSLFSNNIICEKKIDICKYGLELFLTTIIELSTILLASVAVGNFAQTVLFFVSFIPIRIYSGGYHADTRTRCFMVLVVLYIVFSILIRHIYINDYKPFAGFVIIATLISVYIWSPVQHKNKNRDIQQLHKFRTISIILTLLECIITILLVIKNSIMLTPLVFGLTAVLLSILAGKIKYYVKEG